MTTESSPVFSEGFREHLNAHYDDADVAQLAVSRYVDVPYVEGEQVTYARINEGQGVPTLIVAGFTESITSLSPLALEYTNNPDGAKNDVIVVDQQQVGTHIDASKLNAKGRPTTNEATEMQALNYLAVLEKEKPEGPIRIVAHSYGALITQKLIALAQQKAEAAGETSILEGAEVVFVAPAGSHKSENLLKLVGRNLLNVVAEQFSKKSFHDHDKEMLNAGKRNMLANKRRTWQEVRALGRERVDYKRLMASSIGSLAVMALAKDRMYPQRVYRRAMQEAMDAGVTYLTPVEITQEIVDAELHRREQVERMELGEFEKILYGARPKKAISVKGSTHNDTSFTPSRTVNALKQYFEHLTINRLRMAAHQERQRRQADT